MPWRQYACNFFRELQVGNNARGIKFRNGFYETDDPEKQALIEGSQGFGVHIHFVDSIEEMNRLSKKREEEESAEKARKRKEFLAEIDAEEKAAEKREANGEAQAEAAASKKKTAAKLKAADKVL